MDVFGSIYFSWHRKEDYLLEGGTSDLLSTGASSTQESGHVEVGVMRFTGL